MIDYIHGIVKENWLFTFLHIWSWKAAASLILTIFSWIFLILQIWLYESNLIFLRNLGENSDCTKYCLLTLMCKVKSVSFYINYCWLMCMDPDHAIKSLIICWPTFGKITKLNNWTKRNALWKLLIYNSILLHVIMWMSRHNFCKGVSSRVPSV